ncbi:MAG: flagellar basal body rod protein FlgC [Phycisphaeraceae bacterium]|nr:flagellar basal body rod protein FlgC [Phycisphaeraceae bacterium]
MYGLFDISTSGLVAQRVRLETIAANLANQETLLDANGNFAPWRRRSVEFAVGDPAAGSLAGAWPEQPLGVRVANIRESDSFDLRYQPGHPYADAEGYVRYPDVDPVMEQIDALDAVRAYEANIAAVEASKSIYASALGLLA